PRWPTIGFTASVPPTRSLAVRCRPQSDKGGWGHADRNSHRRWRLPWPECGHPCSGAYLRRALWIVGRRIPGRVARPARRPAGGGGEKKNEPKAPPPRGGATRRPP